MILTLDATRRVRIPKALSALVPGDRFEASFDPEADVLVLRRLKRKADWLTVWKECLVAMDNLPSRSRELARS